MTIFTPKRQFLAVLAVFALVLSAAGSGLYPALFAQSASPVGLWQKLDDNKKPDVLIRVWEEGQKLFGKIEKLYQGSPDAKCTECDGERKNQPINGMVILWDLRSDGKNSWSDGRILDPKSGKTYKCKAKLADDGKALEVRGFMGFSFIGRTDRWIRMANAE